jgi:pimeloyl-ACP methyl ester carboxylesterase
MRLIGVSSAALPCAQLRHTAPACSKLRPKKVVSRITCPALFIAARGDKMVPMSHGAKLASRYAGPHEIIYCAGERLRAVGAVALTTLVSR